MAWSNTYDGPCIYWLNGMAGTGKSTIARTVARKLADQNRLGASFFFSRGQGYLGHAEKLFTTITLQLAHALPALKPYICKAISEDYQVGNQGLSEQWEKLIFGPLSRLDKLPSQSLPLVLVIDALDECERDDRRDDIRVILRLLAEAKDLPAVQLRIFLTSRPEIPITHGFSAMSGLTHQDCILHHISKDIIQHDILIFLEYEFERIKRERDLQADWPGEENINSLVQDANGLFIYAATICRFIDRRDPEKQLSFVLPHNRSNIPPLRKSPTQNLDKMYSQVLKSSIYRNYNEDEHEEVIVLFKQTVGSVVILSDILSIPALASLLALPTRDVDEILKQVQALLDVPDSPHLPVRLLHPSFRDFLLDKERCLEVQFWIDEKKAHAKLAVDCLNVMSNALKRDICGLRTPEDIFGLEALGAGAKEIDPKKIQEHFPAELQYACTYWVRHLESSVKHSESSIEYRLLEEVFTFLKQHLLHWFEALSLLGKLYESIHMLSALHMLIQVNNLFVIHTC
jgi:hypothetical protein